MNMKRLTEKGAYSEYVRKPQVTMQQVERKLGEYEDLEEQGLLLRLPCKVGSTLYDITEFVEGYKYPEIYVVDASKIEISKDEKGFLYCIDDVDLRDKHFGTVLFESAEEAEQALAKMKEV